MEEETPEEEETPSSVFSQQRFDDFYNILLGIANTEKTLGVVVPDVFVGRPGVGERKVKPRDAALQSLYDKAYEYVTAYPEALKAAQTNDPLPLPGEGGYDARLYPSYDPPAANKMLSTFQHTQVTNNVLLQLNSMLAKQVENLQSRADAAALEGNDEEAESLNSELEEWRNFWTQVKSAVDAITEPYNEAEDAAAKAVAQQLLQEGAGVASGSLKDFTEKVVRLAQKTPALQRRLDTPNVQDIDAE